jgi:hypothetical protein
VLGRKGEVCFTAELLSNVEEEGESKGEVLVPL